MSAQLRDPSRIRALFEDAGISVAEWARTQGFSTGLVYQVLDGHRRCVRGQSHRIAVALGLKEGLRLEMNEFVERLKAEEIAAAVADKGER